MIKYAHVFLTLIFLTGTHSFANRQTDGENACNDPVFIDQCTANLGDYKFLKAYRIKVKKSRKNDKGPRIQYSYVFSKNTNYKLTVCNNNDGSDMIVEIYDKNFNLLNSSFDPRRRRHYSAIGFRCNQTGIYYVAYTFESRKEDCGVSVLGFKR